MAGSGPIGGFVIAGERIQDRGRRIDRPRSLRAEAFFLDLRVAFGGGCAVRLDLLLGCCLSRGERRLGAGHVTTRPKWAFLWQPLCQFRDQCHRVPG